MAERPGHDHDRDRATLEARHNDDGQHTPGKSQGNGKERRGLRNHQPGNRRTHEGRIL